MPSEWSYFLLTDKKGLACSSSLHAGKFKKSRVSQLGSFVGQTRHSGYHREDFVTDQKFRVRRPGAAVCRT